MHLRTTLFALLLASPAPLMASPTADDMAGRVIARHDGRQIDLPLLESGYRVEIQGDMATVEITQTFANPSDVPLEAEYLFPMNQHAAVYGMEMRVGDEVVQAVIRRKAEAQAEYDAARNDGKAAALLTQHRPNMFTQHIANLMPGLPVQVRLRYVQNVPKIDGRYELVVPMIVGPRYESPADQPQIVDHDTPPSNVWTVSDLPAYPGVGGLDLPETVTGERVSLDVAMIAGVELADFGSDTHPLAVQLLNKGELTATFANGKALDNRDLVLHYTLGGEQMAAAALSHTDSRGGYLSLMIEPPQVPQADTTPAAARELVFVLDTSGSMNGLPMAASKRFMVAALKGLRPGDFFRIIPFANTTQQFSAASMPATPENLALAQHYVLGLGAGGGTEINNAIRTAFDTAQPKETMRIVVFLSDGYIGNEASVLKTIRKKIGQARIYAFGIGNSVNRYLLDGMADEGRGYARYVRVGDDAFEVADQLAADLKTPLLTDIEVDWNGLTVSGVSPERLPDLFAGNSLRLYARHNATGPARIILRGKVNGRPAELPVTLTLTENAAEPALPLMWARARIGVMERNVALGEMAAISDAEITRLGLNYGLQTKNTSFVAVSQQVVNDTGLPPRFAQVPLPQAEAVPGTAYGRAHSSGRAPAPKGFSGSSSPEPQAILGFLMLAALSAFQLRRRFLT